MCTVCTAPTYPIEHGYDDTGKYEMNINQAPSMSSGSQNKFGNLAFLISECLIECGVDTIFYSKKQSLDFSILARVLELQGVHAIEADKSSSAVAMSVAYGRVSGKVGVVIITNEKDLLAAKSELSSSQILNENLFVLVIAKYQTAESINIFKESHINFSSCTVVSNHNVLRDRFVYRFQWTARTLGGVNIFKVLHNSSYSEVKNTKSTKSSSFDRPQFSSLQIEGIEYLYSRLIKSANPLIIIGSEASFYNTVYALKHLLRHVPLPVVSTYHESSILGSDLEHLFFGKIKPESICIANEKYLKSDLLMLVGVESNSIDELVNNAPNKLAFNINETNYVKYENLRNIPGEILGSIDLIYKISLKSIYKPMPKQPKIEYFKKSESIRISPFISQLKESINHECIIICSNPDLFERINKAFSKKSKVLLYNKNAYKTNILDWSKSISLTNTKRKVISICDFSPELSYTKSYDNQSLKIKHYIVVPKHSPKFNNIGITALDLTSIFDVKESLRKWEEGIEIYNVSIE